MGIAEVAALILQLTGVFSALADLQHRLAQGQEPTEADQQLLKAAQESEFARLAKNTGHSVDEA